MPFRPADTKKPRAFERSTVFEEVINRIDDACLLRTIGVDGSSILCAYRVDTLPPALVATLVEIYDEYGWVLTTHTPHSMRGGQDPQGFLLAEKP